MEQIDLEERYARLPKEARDRVTPALITANLKISNPAVRATYADGGALLLTFGGVYCVEVYGVTGTVRLIDSEDKTGEEFINKRACNAYAQRFAEALHAAAREAIEREEKRKETHEARRV